MLSIDDLWHSFGEKAVLKGLSLKLSKGKTLALLGPSGSGKTTLLKVLTGMLPPQKGDVLIEGIPLERKKHHITYMMQEDLLLPWRTVLGNLLLLKEFEATDPKEYEKEALDLLKEVGLEGYESYFPYQLSGGMRKRVAFARALMLRRPLLFLDEPFGGVDCVQKEELYALLKKLQQTHELTMLLITHDLHDALSLADHIAFLSDGSIVEEQKVEDADDLRKKLFYNFARRAFS